jgi:small conductance mechanosensitive channel
MGFLENITWTSLEDWFLGQGIWLLVTIAIGIFAYWALRKWLPEAVKKILNKITIPGTEKKDLQKISQVTSHILLVIGTLIIVFGIVISILPRFGVDISVVTKALKPAGSAVGIWLGIHGVRIFIVIIIGVVAHQISKRAIPWSIERAVFKREELRKEQTDVEEAKKRVETLSHFLVEATATIIWVIASFMILAEIGVNIGPLLASAGVIGIAIGFGAQSLIRDLFNGFFIIIENQYRRGDVVKIANIAGLVENINIRRTILRDLDGTVHVVPNGEVRVSSNLSKDWARVNLNISVSYNEDLDNAIQVMNRVGKEMAEEEYWRSLILEPPKVLRVDNLGNSGIDIKILAVTKPLSQWEVTGELRKRIKRTFDEEGIEIPWPHVKVYFGEIPEKLFPKYDKKVAPSDRNLCRRE